MPEYLQTFPITKFKKVHGFNRKRRRKNHAWWKVAEERERMAEDIRRQEAHEQYLLNLGCD